MAGGGPYKLWEFQHLVPCDARSESPHLAGDRDKTLYLDDKGVPVSGKRYVEAGLHTLLPLRRPSLASAGVHLCPKHHAQLRQALRDASRSRVWPFGSNVKKALAWGAAGAAAGALAYQYLSGPGGSPACEDKSEQECNNECVWHGDACLGKAQARWRAANAPPWFGGDSVREKLCRSAGGAWTPGVLYGGTCPPAADGGSTAPGGLRLSSSDNVATVTDYVDALRRKGGAGSSRARVSLSDWINMDHTERISLSVPPKLLRTPQLPFKLLTSKGDTVPLIQLNDDYMWYAGDVDSEGRPRGDGVLWQKERDGTLSVEYASFRNGYPERMYSQWRRAEDGGSWVHNQPDQRERARQRARQRARRRRARQAVSPPTIFLPPKDESRKEETAHGETDKEEREEEAILDAAEAAADKEAREEDAMDRKAAFLEAMNAKTTA